MKTSPLKRPVLVTLLLAATFAIASGLYVYAAEPVSWEAPKDEAERTPTPPLLAPDTDKVPPEVVAYFKAMFPVDKIERMANFKGRNDTYQFFYHVRGWLFRTVIVTESNAIRWQKTYKYITLAELSPAAQQTLQKYNPKITPKVYVRMTPKSGAVYIVDYPHSSLTVDLDGRIISTLKRENK